MPYVLLLIKGGTEFLYPNEQNGIISMRRGTEFEIHCPGADNGFHGGIAGNSKSIRVTCVRDRTISSTNSNEIDLENIKCLKPVDSVVKRVPGKKCNHNRNDIIEIGFQVGGKWLRLIEVCHDSDKSATLWVHYVMNPLNDGTQRVIRPQNSRERHKNFIQGNFYPNVPNVDYAYCAEGSKKSMRRILGNQTLVDAFLEIDGKNIKISRGHLAAASDFVYGRQQTATFHFLNCAPQWEPFNNGNWNQIEMAIKKMINRINEPNSLVFTGTHGIQTHANFELYLAENAVGGVTQQRIPIPKLFYKIVIMPKLKKGVVFVGVNDLHATQAQLNGGYRLCADVIHLVSHVNDIRNSLKQINNGFIYACDVDSFMAGLKAAKADTLPTVIPRNLDLIA